MPTVRYRVRNEYGLASPELYQAAEKDDPEAILEGVAMAGVVGILRQLGDLAEFAAEIFHDLHEEVMLTAMRGHGLMLRVQQLEAEFPSIEKSFICRTNHTSLVYHTGIEWHANLQMHQNVVTKGEMPRFILDSYEECHGPPRLFMLDKFDTAGAGACLKRFSDPSFFKISSDSSEIEDIAVQRQKKVRKIKKKASHWRNGEGPESLVFPKNISNSQVVPSSMASEKVPERLVKLKSWNFKGSNISSGTYMAYLLEVPFPEQKNLHEDSLRLPISEIKSVVSNELAAYEQEILVDTFTSNSLNKERVLSVSSIAQELSDTRKTKNQSTDNDDEFMEALPERMGAMQNECLTLNNLEHQEVLLNLESEVYNTSDSYYPGEVEDLDNSMHIEAKNYTMELHEMVEKEFLEDFLHKRKNSAGSYRSEDHASELDNYVDALNTMDSEVETDSEKRVKQDWVNDELKLEAQLSDEHFFGNSAMKADMNPSFIDVKHQGGHSYGDEEQVHSKTEYSELDFAERSSVTSVNMFDNGDVDISSSSVLDLSEPTCLHVDSNSSSLVESCNPTYEVFYEKEYDVPQMRTKPNLPDNKTCGYRVADISTSILEVGEVSAGLSCTDTVSFFIPSSHCNGSEYAQSVKEEPEEIPVGTSKGSPKIAESSDSCSSFAADVPDLPVEVFKLAVVAKKSASDATNDGTDTLGSQLEPVDDIKCDEPIGSAESSKYALSEPKEIRADLPKGHLEITECSDSSSSIAAVSDLYVEVADVSRRSHSDATYYGTDSCSQFEAVDFQKCEEPIGSAASFEYVKLVAGEPKEIRVVLPGGPCEITGSCDPSSSSAAQVHPQLEPVDVLKFEEPIDSAESSEYAKLVAEEPKEIRVGLPRGLCEITGSSDSSSSFATHVPDLSVDFYRVDEVSRRPASSDATYYETDNSSSQLETIDVLKCASDAAKEPLLLESFFTRSTEGASILSGLNVAADVIADCSKDFTISSEAYVEEPPEKSTLEENTAAFACSDHSIYDQNPASLVPDSFVLELVEAAALKDDKSNSVLLPELRDDSLHDGNHLKPNSNKFALDPDSGDAVALSIPSQMASCLSVLGEEDCLEAVPESRMLETCRSSTPVGTSEQAVAVSPLFEDDLIIFDRACRSLHSDHSPGVVQYELEEDPPYAQQRDGFDMGTLLSSSCGFAHKHRSLSSDILGELKIPVGIVSEEDTVNVVETLSSLAVNESAEPSDRRLDIASSSRCNSTDDSFFPLNVIEAWPLVKEGGHIGVENIKIDKGLEAAEMSDRPSTTATLGPLCFDEPNSETNLETVSILCSNDMDPIFHSEFMEDMPPPPPLPPIEWRLGKLRLGSLNAPEKMTQCDKGLAALVAVDDKHFFNSESSTSSVTCPLGPTLTILENVWAQQGVLNSKGKLMPSLKLIDLPPAVGGNVNTEGEVLHPWRSESLSRPDSTGHEDNRDDIESGIPQNPDPSTALTQLSNEEILEHPRIFFEDRKTQTTKLSDLPSIPAGGSDLDQLTPALYLGNSEIGDVPSEKDIKQLSNTSTALDVMMRPYDCGAYAGEDMLPRAIGRDFFYTYGENPYITYGAAIPTMGDERPPLCRPRSIRDLPRTPLIQAVASHDKSKMRKVSDLERPSSKPMSDERISLLEQIRSKSFSLKPAVLVKPSTNGPSTNMNVAAILEKASAIRQACAGSDEEDGDSWSDA